MQATQPTGATQTAAGAADLAAPTASPSRSPRRQSLVEAETHFETLGVTAAPVFAHAADIYGYVDAQGVAHFASPLNLLLQRQITLRYGSLECQTFCPKKPPQSPQTSLDENTLLPL